MNEWRVYPPDDYDDTWGYSIKEWDENARTLRVVADSLTEAEAQQIVREHNAHAEMVELVKILRNTIGECSLGAPNYELQQRIDAVLARAEGRTE